MTAIGLALTAAAQQPAATAAAPRAAATSATRAKKHHVSKHDRQEAEKVFLQGARDLEHSNFRAAVEAFAHAAQLDPGTRKYSLSEEIARQHLVTELIQQADKDKILGHLEDSRAKIAEAARIAPANPMVAEHMSELASTTAAGEPALRTESDPLGGPIVLKPELRRRSFRLRTNQRDLIARVLSAYGIQATIDDSITAQSVRYDVDDVDFAGAERTLGLATNSFFVPLDPARVLVAKDTRPNRTKYERQAEETVYLPGMKPDELSQVVNVAKTIFQLPMVYAEASQNAITVRGPAEDLDALNATLKSLLEGQGELQLDVAMYEVNRTRAIDLGMILPTQTSVFNVYSTATSLLQSNASLVQQIISSGLAAPGDWEAILAILVASGQVSNTILSQPFGVFGGGLGMTGVAYQGGSLNLQLNSSDVRAIDELQVRLLNQEEGTIKVGERYPIETSNFSSLSPTSLSIPGISSPGLSSALQNLGVNLSSLAAAASATIPQVQYQDIGLTLKATPHLDGPHEVSLKLDLQLSALGSATINGLPVLNNRQFAVIDSLQIGQSAVLVSSLSRQESNAVSGIPGLSEIPGFQDATNSSTNLDVTELAIVITPHIVRAVRQVANGKMLPLAHRP